MDPLNQNQPNNAQNGPVDNNFNPMADIDISNIEIIDTSKGDKIDFGGVKFNQVYSFKCLNCGLKYEGQVQLERCPRCGSDKIDDTQ
jgi:hypothetical protein